MRTVADYVQAARTGGCEATLREVLDDIAERDKPLGCFTRILGDAAIAGATAVDARVKAGETLGPLAGAPFAVKDLFDVAGLVTTAGAKSRLDAAPASVDAAGVARLRAAGAILIGTLNMDEYAYGFATVNAHFGTTRNPHDLERLAGGSSGGSGASVAAGMVPLTLGSDTNGSIRVPASLCGVWGMRPSRDDAGSVVPLDGVFPFVGSLDTIGPFTRSCGDLKTAYEILSATVVGMDDRPVRVARLGGFFERGASPEAVGAIDAVMAAMNSDIRVDLPEAEAARSAAFLLTARQGGILHLDSLRERAMEYDPTVRDRLLAGAMLPEAIVSRAAGFAATWRRQVMATLDDYDILLAPSTPVTAPRIDEGTIVMDGKAVSARANLGVYAQAIGLAGPTIVSAPVVKKGLPIGVQFVAASGREAMLFSVLQRLEAMGVLGVAPLPEAKGA